MNSEPRNTIELTKESFLAFLQSLSGKNATVSLHTPIGWVGLEFAGITLEPGPNADGYMLLSNNGGSVDFEFSKMSRIYKTTSHEEKRVVIQVNTSDGARVGFVFEI